MGKNDFNYFDKLKNQMAICKKAAKQLIDLLENYTNVSYCADQIHRTEHEGDLALHEIMTELNRSFITPIDREDIVNLANSIDDITDSIEDVSNLFDMFSITEVKAESKTMAMLILRACEVLLEAVSEFSNFKNSKKINMLIIEVNKTEEEGDHIHRSFVKALYQQETNPIEIMKWKEIFDTMEDVLDYCEDVADLLDGLIIKNS